MAPGTPIAGDATADGDGSRGNLHRWPETSKVYTRKIHNKISKINSQPQPKPEPQPPPPPEPPVSAADEVTPSEPPLVEEVHPASPYDASSNQEDSRTVKISLLSKSRDEIRELRKRLAGELEQVRALSRKMEADYGGGDGGGEYAQSQDSAAPAAKGTDEGFEKEEDRMASYCQLSVSIPHANGDDDSMIEVFEKEERTRGFHQLNSHSYGVKSFEEKEGERMPKYRQLSTPETHWGMMEGFEREKRTPKANQLYQNSDFILIGKDKFLPVESNKKLKHNGNGHSNYFLEKKYAHAFKSCAALLARLMKHKFGWVFNTPVDVKGLGLHDYYTIIKHPMDLGTVKLRLNKNWYKSPGEFAEDVRLTFRNAMTYNPKGQDVHIMAQQLSQIFEERWPSIEVEYAYVPYPPTPVAKKPLPIDVRMLERSDSTVYPMAVETIKAVSYPPPAPAPARTATPIGRPPVSRQPKPKAKDLYKREMTTEEKQKLSGHLQNLPPEKLDGVVQIIRKRNAALCLQEDEIEIDIDCVDTETLWELDRLVTNYKKSLSKYKRKAELAVLAKAKVERGRGQERVMEMGVVGEPRENNTVVDRKEEDFSFPVGGENKRDSPSRSSSSSSSTSDSGSSSSDSDSDSSSESD